MTEYLVRIEVNRPSDMDNSEWSAVLQREAEQARRYREAGTIVRIWRIPGTTSNIGIWSASSATSLHEQLLNLPAFPYMSIEVQPLAQHYLEA